MRELTLRAVILGGLITLVFTAANVYLGLKVGLTFATSIPAAVISMAVLRKFAQHTVVENNIVQTIASAAGTLSAIIFVLPGLVMVGWWQGFPYWTTLLVCMIGGVLGVMYSIPLRRALVTGSDLPFPEGVAAAEVLRVGDEQGSAEENRRGLHVIVGGALASAFFGLLGALKAVATEVSTAFKVGTGGVMMGSSLSLALIGVGHLVGITVGIAMLAGVLIAHGVLMPIFTRGEVPATGDVSESVATVFSQDVRFVGAGAMAVAALWTLLKIIGPITRGIRSSLLSSRARKSGQEVELVERDLPFPLVIISIVASMIPIGLLLWSFLRGTEIGHHTGLLITLSVLFTLISGLFIAAVCGYMAGLIGASNSPISSMGIITVLSAALLIKVATGSESQTNPTALVAYTLFTAAVVFGIATISNDNLQDLKTGQLVGATPWKQQVALIIGVIFGSLVIPPILQLMLQAFGFQGAEGAGPDALAAPQAALMSSVAQGIFGDSLDWGKVGLGALIAVGIIAIDETLNRTSAKRLALPPLAVGMGMYLPMGLTLMIVVGSVIGALYNRRAARSAQPEKATRLGVLMATGLIVGESLFGVLNAGIIAATGKASPLAIFPEGYESAGQWVGIVVFALLTVGLYRWVSKKSG
ncbi:MULTISPECIES: OPT family oligopeptide transporter [unclassified Corynebacterium]|uniref:OPT family oligopeptide transporter n=1 Tax=unclassified Corynebacterium TaxID=2624378 RepID=UPI0029CA797D|nr:MULTISPECIES: oligopeptide transporter, OPT family [unclassified Corynebacterium]WPF66338.1 oligopeptide transporter, OPT family [Corynebacterium sp. 22KM0430]WPF68828.1 oligopeptide transporter, OPT family [Corynebacterium sp. 21KM1197]